VAHDEGSSRVRRLQRPPRVGAVYRPIWSRLPRRADGRPGRLRPSRSQDPLADRQPRHGRHSLIDRLIDWLITRRFPFVLQ